MKYVQAQAKDGDATASTLLEECLASLELSKDQVTPPPALIPLVSGETQGDEDEEMAEDDEPSAKKKRGMGAGTPLPQTPPVSLSAQPGAASGAAQAEDATVASVGDVGTTPEAVTAGAVAATEEEIQAVLAQVEAGADWESASKRKAGRPPKPAVMPHGALDKFVTVTPVAS
eukprot:4224048-Amphidinium_carterae.1